MRFVCRERWQIGVNGKGNSRVSRRERGTCSERGSLKRTETNGGSVTSVMKLESRTGVSRLTSVDTTTLQWKSDSTRGLGGNDPLSPTISKDGT